MSSQPPADAAPTPQVETADPAVAETKSLLGEVRQEAGQRRWGGPPEGWEGPPPPKRGSEVFVGKLPRDVGEAELLPVLQRAGRLWELRLMVDFSGANRGFCFATYGSKEEARQACALLNNFELRQGKHLGVVMSIDNCRLFVGGIPRERQREEILLEMEKLVEGVRDVIVYPSATDKSKNRGFAFVEFDSHKAAAQARRRLGPGGRVQLWGQPICVDWAEPEQEVDEGVMATVRVLYVRNLMLSTTEDAIKQHFDALRPGTVERVKKLKDFAFVHYTNRQAALENLEKLNGSVLDSAVLEVQLSKPPDKTILRYVKSAQKSSGLSVHGQNAQGLSSDVLAAATHNFLHHQASSHPTLPVASPTDPVAWAYTGAPFVHAPQPSIVLPSQPDPTSRVVSLHRGAAGMRSAGFVAHVNKHVRNARNRRSGDAAVLPYDPNYPYPPVLASPIPASPNQPTAPSNVVWLPAVQAHHLQALHSLALQQQLGVSQACTTLSPNSATPLIAKASEQLEEYCRIAGLGQPEIEVEEVNTPDLTGNQLTLYTASVLLPTLAGLQGGATALGKSGNPFRSPEEAKECACQLALIQLGAAAASIPFHPTPTLMAQPNLPSTSH